MKTALFLNFTNKPFTGYWNGKPHTFKAGEKKYMPEYLASHFAKHLTNQVLIEQGKETSTSPKNPEQVPLFMEIFNKACIIENEAEEQDEAELEIEIANKEISSNMNVKNKKVSEKSKPIVKSEKKSSGDDDEDFEGLKTKK